MLDVNFINPNKYQSVESKMNDQNELEASQKADDAAISLVERKGEDDSKSLRHIISSWYKAFRNIAIVGLLIVLVYLGIRILISSASSDKAKYKEHLYDWVVAFCLIFFMHYIMAGILTITENFNELVDRSINKKIYVDASAAKEGNIITTEQIEEAKFQTTLTGYVRFMVQSDEEGDTYAYGIMFFALIIYTFMFTITYVKRFLYVAFFTMISPLVALTYPLDKIRDGKAQAFSMWFKEFTMNVIIQPVHLILYSVFIGSVMDLATSNLIYALVAMGFLLPAEKFIKKLFGLDRAETSKGFGEIAGGALAMKGMANLLGTFKGDKKKNGQSGDGTGETKEKIRGADKDYRAKPLSEAMQGMGNVASSVSTGISDTAQAAATGGPLGAVLTGARALGGTLAEGVGAAANTVGSTLDSVTGDPDTERGQDQGGGSLGQQIPITRQGQDRMATEARDTGNLNGDSDGNDDIQILPYDYNMNDFNAQMRNIDEDGSILNHLYDTNAQIPEEPQSPQTSQSTQISTEDNPIDQGNQESPDMNVDSTDNTQTSSEGGGLGDAIKTVARNRGRKIARAIGKPFTRDNIGNTAKSVFKTGFKATGAIAAAAAGTAVIGGAALTTGDLSQAASMAAAGYTNVASVGAGFGGKAGGAVTNAVVDDIQQVNELRKSKDQRKREEQARYDRSWKKDPKNYDYLRKQGYDDKTARMLLESERYAKFRRAGITDIELIDKTVRLANKKGYSDDYAVSLAGVVSNTSKEFTVQEQNSLNEKLEKQDNLNEQQRHMVMSDAKEIRGVN